MICVITCNVVRLIKAHRLTINITNYFSRRFIKPSYVGCHVRYGDLEESQRMQDQVKRRTNNTSEVVISDGPCGCLIEMLTAQQVLDHGLDLEVATDKGVCHFCDNGTIDSKAFLGSMRCINKEPVNLPADILCCFRLSVDKVNQLLDLIKRARLIWSTTRCQQWVGLDGCTVETGAELFGIVVMR